MNGRRTTVVLSTLTTALFLWAAAGGVASAAPHGPTPTPTPTPRESSASSKPKADDTDCTVPVAPPPAIDASERPRPGESAPEPLPVPEAPVGGPRMGECGLVLPTGAPRPPAGVDAVSWVLADLDTGAVLAARNPHARERPASLLKILTSLVIMDKLDMDDKVTGTAADGAITGSRVGVGPGGEYTVQQLFTGLIMNSGNDAANALARQLGGVPATLKLMSDKAASLGALDTRPTSPSGLDAPGMSTSAYDLAVFYRQAIKQPIFAEISRTRLFDWPGRGNLPGFKISNDNKMLATYPGTLGGKTGFTDDARHTRVTAAQRNSRRLVVVQMRGEQHPVPMDTQAARLLDYGFSLPANTPAVGKLVDRNPELETPTPTTMPMDLASAPAATPDVPAEETPEHRAYALGTIGGGAVLGGLLSWLIARRRPEESPELSVRGGRHSTSAPPPPEN
ncbi:D-alanyl-D-alanine carboxypeptidase family protein [Pseudonocardia spinosispora]|uniref:D-alanyl-D-alanine carboxypeptidase family protein n=1 Tax=Pseudonocardia spinosispora TaxID=103441 RepID=UPI0004115539|nr:D-alanyl-D-alanine carboxypeptidase family protein [Pseudonocardia spinosispora]